jgi:hypothetical protein
MGEPIQLHSKGGKILHVYSRSQAETLLSGGSWYATAADAEAGKAREEPTPTTAARLEALDGDGGGARVVKTAPPVPAGFEDVEAVEAIITVKKEPDDKPAPASKKAAKSQ